MQKLIFILNALAISATLLTTMPSKSMELAPLNKQFLQDLAERPLQEIATELPLIDREQNRSITLGLMHNKCNMNSIIYPESHPHFTLGDLLLKRATIHSDINLVKELFTCDSINPHAQARDKIPVFFYATNLDIVQMYIDKKINVHATELSGNTNVLRKVLHHRYPSEVLSLYLTQGVDPRNKSVLDNSCLFHELIEQCKTLQEENYECLLNKTKLLLEAAPDIINTLTLDGESKTPFDLAYAFLNIETTHDVQVNQHRAKHKKDPIINMRLKAIGEIIELYRDCGALTGSQLIELSNLENK